VSEARPLPKWLPAAGVAVALALMVTMSFLERWSMLTRTDFPVGVDGYFYPIQLRSILETGSLAYPSAPLAFYAMTPFAALTDPITGAKLGAALFGALVALPAYGVGARLGRCRGAGLVAAAIATPSAGSAFLTIEFVKNSVGLTVLVTGVWLLLRALERPSAVRIGAAVAGALAALLTHKMAIVMLLAIAVPAILAAASSRGLLRGRRLLYVLALVLGVTALLAVLGIAFPQQLPSAAQIDLSQALAGDAAYWDAPALAVRGTYLTFGHEALIGALVGAVGIALLTRGVRTWLEGVALPAGWQAAPPRRGLPGETAVAWTVCVLAVVIAWPWLDVTDVQGLGFRLRVAAFVPFALAASVVAGKLVARVKHRDFGLAVVALALAMRAPGDRDDGRIDVHPSMVSAIIALDGAHVPAEDTIIVPERHIVYMVAWYTRHAVRILPASVPPEHRWRLIPLAWIGFDSPLEKALTAARAWPRPPLGLHPRHPNGLVLMPEATWERVLEALPANVRTRWSRWQTI
jgi:hypothetical protein